MASFTATQHDVHGAFDEKSLDEPFLGVRVVNDPVKGRCLENLVSRQPGDLLYVEEALVFSSFVEYEEGAPDGVEAHVNGGLLLRAFGEDILAELHDIHDELSNLPRVECLDTARNFLQLVALMHLRETLHNESQAIWARSLSLLCRLSPGVYMDELLGTIRTFRHAYPRVLPIGMSDSDAAICLGILNTNQVELEDFGGSGLFVGTAIMEHSCAFNCSYTTHGSTLYMAATRAIAPGERLCIDYGNYFYSPTLVRKLSLFESYGFVCTCAMCDGAREDEEGASRESGLECINGVDRKRAFWCMQCKQQGQVGVVCPIGPTTDGLRTALRTSAAHADARSSIKKNTKKSKKGGKSKSKKSPAKVCNVDEEENEEEETDLNAIGMDVAALAEALEQVALSWAPCSTCGIVPSPVYTRRCLSREEYYRQNPPETYQEIVEAGTEADGYLHESHHLLFQALDTVSHELTNQARRCMDFGLLSLDDKTGDGKVVSKKGKKIENAKGTREQRQHALFEPALTAMQHSVRLLDQVLPLVHQEKVVFYDRLGQLAVCAGRTDLARTAFNSAYQLSMRASGLNVPQTQQLLVLAERTPLTREELMKHYSKPTIDDMVE